MSAIADDKLPTFAELRSMRSKELVSPQGLLTPILLLN